MTTLGDGGYWFYEYDALGQVKSGRRYLAGGQPVMGQQFDYQFDDIGNRRQANTGNGRRASYANNLLNEVESRDVPGYVNVAGTVHSNATVTINDQLPAAMRQGEYFFKEFQVLNLSSAKWAGLTNLAVLKGTGTNQDKQISQSGWAYVAQTPEFFSYDLDGNLVSDGRWSYTWNGENRLVGMESIAGVPTAAKAKLVFEYDWLGRRTRKLTYAWNPTLMGGSYVLAQERRYVYDGWNLVAELDEVSGPVRSFIWGPDLSGSLQGAGGVGGLLGVKKWHRNQAPYYGLTVTLGVLGDGNGNVTGLLDMGTGTQVAWYEYGPFGEGLRVSGAWAWANPFRFSTKFQDEETDLYYYGYRYYNPSTGRWLGRDPIEESGGVNLYGMVGNDPINSVDYLGLSACDKFKKKIVEKQTEISKLSTKIGNIDKDIRKRKGELHENPGGLPWSIPGQPISQNPATTRGGHVMIVNELKMHLNKHEGERARLILELAALQAEYAACVQAEKGVRKGLCNVAKKCVKFVVRKSPLGVLMFACESADGGVVHATNELVWPISELWSNDISAPLTDMPPPHWPPVIPPSAPYYSPGKY